MSIEIRIEKATYTCAEQSRECFVVRIENDGEHWSEVFDTRALASRYIIHFFEESLKYAD